MLERQFVFIAYFDILGFKQMVNNTTAEELLRVINGFTFASQGSISEGKLFIRDDKSVVYDIRKSNIRCAHISDSIIFWSKSNTEGDFVDMIKLCQSFLLSTLLRSIPVRGCLTYGELFSKFDRIEDYYSSLLFGKGLVSAYTNAETLEFVGCVVDNSINDVIFVEDLEKVKGCLFQISDIPHKEGIIIDAKLIVKVKPNMNKIVLENLSDCLKSSFTHYQKMEFNDLAKEIRAKYNNTIKLWKVIYNIGKS